jgi:hypothetical protein
LLSGEAGIGKSRLTAALLERLTEEPHTRLRYFCSPQHTDSALYPIISQMERAAEFVHDDTLQAKLDKLDVVLERTSTSKQEAGLFAEMLSLANNGRYPVLELTSEQRRQRTLEALVSQVQTLTHQSPVLMIFEDAHWSDPTSLEVLGRIVDRVRSLPVLLLVTFRPEFDPPWLGRPYVTALTINRLAERDISAMIDRVVGNKLPSRHLDGSAPVHVVYAYSLRKLRGSKGRSRRTCCADGRKRRKGMEGWRNVGASLAFCCDRQDLGRGPNAHFGYHRMAVDRIDSVYAVVLITFGKSLCGTKPI